MFLLGHLGFTAAPGALAARWWGKNRGFSGKAPDLRWLLAGSILPDIVDKTVGQVFLKPYFENGRIFCHTTLFALLMLIAGAYRVRRKGDNRVLLLALGIACHLVLDRMWSEPVTALWPAMGPFTRYSTLKTLIGQIADSLKDPSFWISEAGGIILLILAFRSLGIRDYTDLKGFLLRGVSPFLVRFEEDH